MQESFREFLVTFLEANGSRAKTVLIHTHPNYGQVHIYLTDKENAEPYEDLVGYLDIEVIFEDDSLEETSRDQSGFCMPDGTKVVPRSNSEFNVIFAQHCAVSLSAYLPSLPLDLCPDKMIVEAESGEVKIVWWPRPKRG